MRPACCRPVRAMNNRRISLVPCSQKCEGQSSPAVQSVTGQIQPLPTVQMVEAATEAAWEQGTEAGCGLVLGNTWEG